jgi:type I restriction enzyme S subunit
MSQAENQVIPEGYKQTEVGVIPDDWDVCTLANITEKKRPISYGIVQTGPEIYDGIPCLRVLDIVNCSINTDNLIRTTQKISNSYKRTQLKENDLVIPLRGKVGEVGIIGKELVGANLTRGVALIALEKKFIPQYVKQALCSEGSQNRLLNSMNGSALQEISIGTLRSFKLSIPKLPEEQTAIANALSDMDTLLSELESLIAKKQAIKTATMQQLLTGKTRLPQFAFYSDINSTEDAVVGKRNNASATNVNVGASDDGSLASQESRGMDSRRKSTKPSELGEIPEDWEVYKIGSVLSITTGSRNTQDKLAEGQYPFFVRSQTIERINTYSFDGEAVLTAGDGVGTGKIFHYMNGKFDYHQRVYLMHNFGEKIDGYFFYIYFSNFFYDRIMSMTAKSSVDSVRREMIADMLITLPPKQEQTVIATILSDMDNEIQTLEQRLSKTRQIKQGMMQELLTGKTRLPFARLVGESDAD